jgi:hypothetical protein
MAGVAKERIRDWMRRRFPPQNRYVTVFECADVTQMLSAGESTYGLTYREGMLFASRDHEAPAPRKELIILTSVLASYSAERIITLLEEDAIDELVTAPHRRRLVDDNLRVYEWGQSSTGTDESETQPCDVPHSADADVEDSRT